MGQVAFDTQEFVETLENAGLPKEQAKAISIAVRKSHEAVDVATKRDLEDVRKDLSAEITLVRKDVEALTNSLLIKLSGVMLAIVGAAATIVTLVIKLV
ncbi:hypothetical protein [Candidatus Williamhamiltonella defendens]|uniref:DUF1640 domain-containing protein n=1 Tax=Candidatus Hamiltonella defensa (Bemisia tabaci) TaxID=672795 RepID=A0A249DYX0_9ENTR|nr:hypothetical protein [Candidatus Hamiltonella defensa]ASX26107.1 DUF1640 domain-containing protein [Candidatus Hamiltonella defensa (Bemisia tabaci)]CED78218.1 Conserved hypothetical phage protein [Candidatus Hamiltonella defensa (Bemisia tabaci)]